MKKKVTMLVVCIMLGVLIPVGVASPVKAVGNLNPTLTYVIYADADSYTQEANPNTNYGSVNWMSVGNNSGFPNTGRSLYIHYNLSSLPDNLQIDMASFRLYLYDLTNNAYPSYNSFNVRIREVLSTWTEAGLTWNTAPAFSMTNFTAKEHWRISPLNPLSGIPSPYQNMYSYEDYDATPFTQRWYGGTAPNYGITIQNWDGSGTPADFVSTLMTFATKEAVGFGRIPMLVIQAHSLTSSVHLSYYSTFTGLGLPNTEFNVSTRIGAGAYTRTTTDLTGAMIGQNLTVIVRDFFGRALYNKTMMITDSDYFWDINISAYSYRVTNNGDQFTRWWIYYSPTAPPYREYIAPHETVEFLLLPGWYRFACTPFDSQGVAQPTVTFIRTISDSGYIMLDGATISEVALTVNNILSTQQVITSILTPDIIWVGYDMPSVPAYIQASTSAILDTRYLVDGNSMQIKSGTYEYFNSTIPAPSTVTTRTVVYDYFNIIGAPATTIYINESTGGNVYNSTMLPSSLTLNGSDYRVWTNSSISISRNLWFRYSKDFSYHYYPTGNSLGNDLYLAEVTIHNPSDTDWSGVGFFIPFQNSTRYDNRSVVVKDMNNTITLIEGTNYVLSASGVHMFFTNLSAGAYRGFKVSYTTTGNETTAPHIIVNTLGDGTNTKKTWQGDTWWFSIASWTNSYRESYSGSIYIEMMTTPAMDVNQQIVVQTSTGYVLTDVIVAGNTIIIPSASVDVGGQVVYTILFKSAPSQSNGSFSDLELYIISILLLVAVLCLAFSLIFKVLRKKDPKAEKFANGLLLLSIIAMAGIVFMVIYVMGTGTVSARMVADFITTVNHGW